MTSTATRTSTFAKSRDQWQRNARATLIAVNLPAIDMDVGDD
jgi:hypothetical protein